MKNSEENTIAIIGMAGRFPGAKNIQKMWTNLLEGVCSIESLTKKMLQLSGVSEELMNHPYYVPKGAILSDADLFAADYFNISPREATLMDPQHRIFLELAYQTCLDAGYQPSSIDGKVGIFGGAPISTYFIHHLNDYYQSNRDTLDVLTLLHGNSSDYLCSRVGYKLNFKGPTMSIQTACSTSLVSVHTACESLLTYQCDMALAGGVTVQVPQLRGYLYHEGGILSKSGVCRPFDDQADGVIFGSGAGMVLLKRIEDALRDKDYIYAVIKGSAVNNDGAQRVGFTAPSQSGQERTILEALNMADLSPELIHYVETHGTGTKIGDAVEMSALRSVFKEAKNKIALGAIKANIGHLNAASGIAGLIKTVCILNHKKIPPQIHFNPQNSKNDSLDALYFNKETVNLPLDGNPVFAGVSSFGMGGVNAHVVLADFENDYHKQPSEYHLERKRYWAQNDDGSIGSTGDDVSTVKHKRSEKIVDCSSATDIEKTVVALVSNVLGIEKIGLDDDFFDFGGDSLSFSQLIARLQEKYLLELTVTEMSNYTTVRQISEYLDIQLEKFVETLSDDDAEALLSSLEQDEG